MLAQELIVFHEFFSKIGVRRDAMNPQQIEQFVSQQIPITKMLGVKVLRAEYAAVELSAPLALNHNHLGTAFGGSMNAIAVLTGYMWLYMALDSVDLDGDVLLKSSRIDYFKPVTEDIRAICASPSSRNFKKFLSSYKRKGIGRLTLEAQILLADGSLASEFSGDFIVRTKVT